MDFNVERVDPFADTHTDMWMRIEHLGRYLLAVDALTSAGCSFVADLACGTGYGSAILAQAIGIVVGADRDEQAIAEAKRKYGGDGVTFCHLDFDNEPFELSHVPLHVLGQDICNRVVATEAELVSANDASEEQLQNLLNVRNDSDIMLATRLFGYPSDVAPDESYSHIYVCRRC